MSATSPADAAIPGTAAVVVSATSTANSPSQVRENETLAAALELLMQLESLDDLQTAAAAAADAMRDYMSAGRVLIGWCTQQDAACKLIGDTHGRSDDPADTTRRKAEFALDELVIRARPTSVNVQSGSAEEHGQLAIQNFAQLIGARNLIGSPLIDHDGNIRGAWMFTNIPTDIDSLASCNIIDALSRPLGARLTTIARYQPGLLVRIAQGASGLLTHSRSNVMIVGLMLLLVVIFFPVTYNVRCDCALEPVSRRYIAAPFAGALDKSYVQPGDTIERNALLARMKARELDWELAGLRADFSRADKERKVSLAGGEYAQSQIADLESQRIRHRTDLLEHRITHLEIRSPIKGVVVSGDNKEVEGAPLEIGQTLYEIAPLGEMIVELMVPEEDFAYVSPDMPVRLRSRAFPGDVLEGRVMRMHPKAEIKDNDNVFIAEMKIRDPHGIYRPGMHGRAAIASGKRPLLWVLLHKPWNALMMWLGW